MVFKITRLVHHHRKFGAKLIAEIVISIQDCIYMYLASGTYTVTFFSAMGGAFNL